MRVVSVLPSATEIVFALGHGEELVGRSAECDYPAEASTRPVVMWPRDGSGDRSSREIDSRVRAVRSTGEALYRLDVERLRSLAPDLLITQDLCGVCSVTEQEVESACESAGVRPTILSVSPRRLEEVWRSVETIATALGDAPAGARVARPLRERSRPVPGGAAPRIAVVEWLDPPILAGLWSPDIVLAAGGIPIGPAPGAPGLRTTWKAIAAENPDLLVLTPCSFSVDRTRRELADPSIASEVASVPAPAGTFIADEAYFSRPGPRLVHGVELLRTLLGRSSVAPPMPVKSWRHDAGKVPA